MVKEDIFHLFGINDLRLLPEAMMPVVLSSGAKRHDIYRSLMAMNGFDMSRDWFQEIYESEQAERKAKKQDFTPAQVGLLTAMLTDNGTARQSIYEPTAGNGSMIIQKWWNQCLKKAPWGTYPDRMRVECWELSDRSIPILLLNLSIRGITGTVFHGDVLEQRVIAEYRLTNIHNDPLAFSEVTKQARTCTR